MTKKPQDLKEIVNYLQGLPLKEIVEYLQQSEIPLPPHIAYDLLAPALYHQAASDKTPFQKNLECLLDQHQGLLQKYDLNLPRVKHLLLKNCTLNYLHAFKQIIHKAEEALKKDQFSNQFLLAYEKILADMSTDLELKGKKLYLERNSQKTDLPPKIYYLTALHTLGFLKHSLPQHPLQALEELTQDQVIKTLTTLPQKIEKYPQIPDSPSLLKSLREQYLQLPREILHQMEKTLYHHQFSPQFITAYEKTQEMLEEEDTCFFPHLKPIFLNLSQKIRAYHLASLHTLSHLKHLLNNYSPQELAHDETIKNFKESLENIQTYDQISGISHQKTAAALNELHQKKIETIKPQLEKKQKQLYQKMDTFGEIAFLDDLTIYTTYQKDPSDPSVEIAFPRLIPRPNSQGEDLKKELKKRAFRYFQFCYNYSQILKKYRPGLQRQLSFFLNQKIEDHRSKFPSYFGIQFKPTKETADPFSDLPDIET